MFHHWIYCVLWKSWNISWFEVHHTKNSIYVFISFFICIYILTGSLIALLPWCCYQLYKTPNKKQTDFQNLSHQESHYISMRRYSPVTILYVEKLHHCFVSSKILQPKLHLRSFYDLLLSLRTGYLSQWRHIKERKKMTRVIFLLYLYLLSAEKSDMLFYYISLYFI